MAGRVPPRVPGRELLLSGDEHARTVPAAPAGSQSNQRAPVTIARLIPLSGLRREVIHWISVAPA